MSIAQFLRILMARRMVIMSTFFVGAAIALALCFILKPRYPATARILMDVIKPDPVSGTVIASSFVRGYTRTQIELITDYRVAGDVVDKLGWENNPLMVDDFKQNSNGTEDFRRYKARGIIDNTDAELVQGSNILEITYTAGNPIIARTVVSALRSAYIDASLRFRTDAAGRSADWYVDQAQKAQQTLASAEGKKSAFERENGIVMAPGGADSETMKLEAMQGAMLSAQTAAGVVDSNKDIRADQSGTVASLRAQLNGVEDSLATASQKLGTSHPTYVALAGRRAVLQQQLARETALAHSQGGSTASASQSNASRLDAEVTAQKAKVLALKPQLDELAQLQREVDLRRSQYEKAAQRAADLKLEADVSETGLVSLGDAVVSGVPAFPNKPLILALGAAGGLGLGIILAIAAELLSRRVRGPEDLARAANVAVLAVIAGPVPMSFGRRVLRFFHIGGETPPATGLIPAR